MRGIDTAATSLRIEMMCKSKGYTVTMLQNTFGFNNPQAIYKWFNPSCKTLPSLDNFYELADILGVTMDELIVPMTVKFEILDNKTHNKNIVA